MLTERALAALRNRAREEASARFVNPTLIKTCPPAHSYPQQWRRLILDADRAYPEWEARYLLAFAAEQDAERLARYRETEHRPTVAEGEREPELSGAATRGSSSEWHDLRDSLPVPVFVGHNWSVGHHEGWATGKDHIVVQEALHAGRLHRDRHDALCETKGKKQHPGRLGNPLRALDRSPEGTPGGPRERDRVPTCRKCLQIARRLAQGSQRPRSDRDRDNDKESSR